MTYLQRVADIADVIRTDAPEADRNRRLGDATVAAVCDSGVTRMMVPPALGGGGISWADSFEVVEAIARLDGATGWNASIWAGTATLCVTLAGDDARDEVLGDPSALCSASLNWMNIQARRVDGGYRFDGKATFLSGSSHAQWLSLGGWLIGEDGKPVFGAAGPEVIRGVLPMSSIPIEDTWHVAGLRATASNDAVLDGVFIPDAFISDPHRAGDLVPDGATHIPIQSRFGAPFAFVGLGIARGAIDALRDVAGERVALATSSPMRERVDVQIDVARAQALVEAGEAFLVRTWERSTTTPERLTVEDLAMLRLSYVTAADNAAQATELVRRCAGSSAVYESERIERCWRDAHVVPAHVMVSPRGYERVGRVLLGLEPLPGLL
ncbi:MAG TPA: acyl-CoA dehydrogenase family protein [Acidimicrobiales bacterium]|nr:acyl-CoA dehydrogenase family protein [Acidimicrobiales bacterium]